MTKKGGRKSQSQDELAKKLFTESKTEDMATPQKSNTKKTPKSAKKRKFDKESDTENMAEQTKGLNQEMNIQSSEVSPGTKPSAGGPAMKTPKSTKKTPKAKTPSRKAGNKADDEVTFNFEARSAKKAVNPDSSVAMKSTEGSAKKVQKAAGGDDDTDGISQPDDVAMEAAPAAEPDDVAMETKETVAKVPLSERKLVKRPTAIKAQSKKRKSLKQKKEVSAQEKGKEETDGIFFYCGNLPPGVTKETLTFFLEEEGIHRPSIKLNTVKKWNAKDAMAGLTPKERGFKKNMMKAAKSIFATIIVKTEEEAKKLLDLQGFSMPAPIRNDWSTNLKIVRRLPRFDNFPYKVHVGGLHKEVLEDELKTYLETKGVKPGKVVIIRRHKTTESKRYGFIWFETVKEADRAVDLPEPTIREKTMKIEHSFKKKFKNF